MKKIFTVFALAAALLFVVSCGGGNSKDGDKTDTEETVADDDTADTEPTGDTESTCDTEPSGDTEPTEKPDEDTDTPQDDWREEAKECEKLGGSLHGATGTCRKYIECPEKPELTEWNGSDFFHIEYKDGAWEEKEVASEYNEEEGECHFICDSDFDLVWTGTKCEDFCFLKCNDVENTVSYICDHEKGSETYACRCSIGYEWHADTKTCENACEEGYYWNEAHEGCVKDGCFDAVCGEHSDGICVKGTLSDYSCGCDEGYFWSTSNACWKSDVCHSGVCGEHSTGYCYQTGVEEYRCNCETGYYWNTIESKCIPNPCVSNPCNSLSDFTDITCTPYSSTEYSCDGQDIETNFIWSAKSQNKMDWNSAKSYCDDLEEGGSSDWHLPDIDELKTLLKNADRVSTNCLVSKNCTASSCWTCSTCTETGTQLEFSNGCSDWGTEYTDGRYSKFGDSDALFSSNVSENDPEYAWQVDFEQGSLSTASIEIERNVRCVKH